MRITAVRAWLQAALLVPVAFALVISAAVLGVATTTRKLPPAGYIPPPKPGPVDRRPSDEELSGLTISLPVPLADGQTPLAVTVRITTAPPVPRDTLEAARDYLTGLLKSLVTSLPGGWTPDAGGLETLRRAIKEAVPVALAPSLGGGTHVTVSADVTAGPAGPDRPSP